MGPDLECERTPKGHTYTLNLGTITEIPREPFYTTLDKILISDILLKRRRVFDRAEKPRSYCTSNRTCGEQ